MDHTLQVLIRRTMDKDGCFARVPELKGCHAQGDNIKGVVKNIKEAIGLYWSTLRPAGIKRGAQ